MDISKLDSGQKLAAAAFVLSREDLPIPAPPTVRSMIDMGSNDIARAIDRIKKGEPHRFANLFGAIGATSGGAIGAALGAMMGDRKAWTATLIGIVSGAYPPALAGFVIDKVADR